MSLLKNTSNTKNHKKAAIWTAISLFSLLALILLIYLSQKVPMATSVDFSSIRKNLGNQKNSGLNDDDKSSIQAVTSDNAFHKQRVGHINEARARAYVDDALMDYYRGNYSEAVRRTERAKFIDPANFSALRLSAQVYLELRKYKKAYNDLERAKQIPNEDDTLSKDLDVVRKLIRYTRSETDRLKRYTYRHPDDRVAIARLNELIEQMEE